MAERVGPVLRQSPLTGAATAALRELNPSAEFCDRGSYVRVLAPEPCRLTRDAFERHAGKPLTFPGDLEAIMPSFSGRLSLNADEAVWEAFGPRGAP
jgi:hypothetical protein